MTSKLSATAVLALLVSACSQNDSPAADPKTEPPVGSGSQAPDSVGELSHTAWQLVTINNPDGTSRAPADPSTYTLEFMPDGTLAMQIDCNRANGPWASSAPGQLSIGPVASTRALCPPESLHDAVLAGIEAVTEYVIEDELLFLRAGPGELTLEYEHATEPPLAAVVLGEEVRTDDAGEMQASILTALFEDYEARNGIFAEESEIDAFISRIDQLKEDDVAGKRARLIEIDRLLKTEDLAEGDRHSLESEQALIDEFIAGMETGEDLDPDEAGQIASMRRSFAQASIMHWKLNRALYDQYGGRIIGQQFGPEPLDAYREFLQERKDAGAFEILRPDLEQDFWRYFTDDSIHSFLEPGSEEEASAFASPPWSP